MDKDYLSIGQVGGGIVSNIRCTKRSNFMILTNNAGPEGFDA